MSFIDNDNYDVNYQRYQDWKHEQEEEDRYYEGRDLAAEYEYDLQREQEVEERMASQYIAEQEEEEEEDVRQLAQVMVNGIYCYELDWLPNTNEVRVEVDGPDGEPPLYFWYPDTMGTMEVLSRILEMPKERLSITDLVHFGKFPNPWYYDQLREYNIRTFTRATWRGYAEMDVAMQFNVNIAEEEKPVVCPNECYDAACDGTNCEIKPQLRVHGIDGTHCDCFECGEQHDAI